MMHSCLPSLAAQCFRQLVWLCVTLLPVYGWAKDRITWAIYDLPPTYIIRDPLSVDNLGDGIADRLLAQLAAAMPEYEHGVEVMNMQRAVADLRAGRHLCVFDALKTPERSKVAYSTPLLLAPALQVVFNSDVLLQHPKWQNGVALSNLVADAAVRGQYVAGRGFGERLDGIIYSSANVGLKPNGGASGVNALRMVALGRADYTIESPEMIIFLRKSGEVPGGVTTVPILDADQFLYGYVLCTRNDWGLQVTRRVDSTLRHLASTPAYRQAVERWLPQEELMRHRKEYDEYFQGRASKSWCQDGCP